MPTRKVDTLQITEADKAALLTEIYPYWENKSIGDLSRHYIDERIMQVLDSPYRVFNPLSRARSGYGHYLPDIQKIISHGFRKVEEEAKDCLESLDILDPEFTDKTHFYKAVLIVCQGIRRFSRTVMQTWRNRWQQRKVISVENKSCFSSPPTAGRFLMSRRGRIMRRSSRIGLRF